jgi:preprotein translocase subunit SecE
VAAEFRLKMIWPARRQTIHRLFIYFERFVALAGVSHGLVATYSGVIEHARPAAV